MLDQADPDSNLLGHFFTDTHKKATNNGIEVVDIYSDRDCGPGEQLFEAYGESHNGFMAQWFGFVADPNPSDVLRLKWKFVPGQGERAQEKLKMLNAFRGAIRTDFTVRLIDQLPSTVVYYLQLTTLPPERAVECSKKSERENIVACISNHRPAHLYDELELILKERLGQFSSSLDQDLELVTSLSGTARLAVEWRIHQKKIGHHVLSLIEQLRKKRDEL
eukprot:TRINITY_DN11405_c0_g3_i1.p1 TRINITY_DN11405_c0_g3~~TRINITY_DN11405_c0_g3_i1.p1  ORF type:complete len:220 (+),score=45.73 TRINITY_DN11405_c0_g3_i1:126-785(+)